MSTIIKHIIVTGLIIWGLSHFGLINFSWNSEGISNLTSKAKEQTTALAKKGMKAAEEAAASAEAAQ